MEAVTARPIPATRAATSLVVAAFLSFLAANLLHNRFGIDPAIAPAALFTGLYLWKARRWMMLAAAFFIAVPSFLFLRWSALADPSAPVVFGNHAALLLGGALALAAAALALRSGGAAA